ncbi:CDP-diacylglycerol--serine O-phosphatidyltransferase [Candidatus Endomicrobiellum agilis]|jgi:CDP-diacylglycerol--serine O-phosphatidyltransferase|uniref:CDP-diacylglycerol--serine O-phosphatidyltransferase n=1 Tax=Candidatus Endomicrobiellum agilis TaxID=3238957 RepID=UPI00284023C5|nr:CDP-diacylglycerol--serine O-phosphatidyltransferase [Endomicrobium sp.]MCA6084821.1 CDP-diacylglycerol--serine O-phosphatidyltransferase [Endomicrobium sp.]MDR3092442.1 CDP-diacylglycerol--serine O-phosphatidyltransferase [Endomicrobium sp.]
MDEKLKKGIYIVPSLFTCGNITCGCLSTISSINGNFTKAAWLLIFAIVFDMTDGRVARLTKTTSEFGVQMDSLSDLVSFGIAPSVMMYLLVLNSMGKIGTAISVLFILCSALRLAKFNVKACSNDSISNFFMGLPTPASAGLLISFVLSYELFIAVPGQSLTFKTIPILMKNMPVFFKTMPIVMVVLSLLMVSNIPYVSFKKINVAKPKAFKFLILTVLLIWLTFTFPQNIIFILFTLYAFSGILSYVIKYWKVLKRIFQQR